MVIIRTLSQCLRSKDFTRFLVGTSIGTTTAIVLLSIAAIPFMGRLMETSLQEVDWGIIEAARAMGSSRLQIITKVPVSEALLSIVSGITITASLDRIFSYSRCHRRRWFRRPGNKIRLQAFHARYMLYTVIIWWSWYS